MPTNNVLTASERNAIERAISEVELCCQFSLANELRDLLSAHPPQPIANDAPVAQRHSWTTTGMKRDPQGHWVIASHVGVPEPRAEVADDDKRDAERYRWLRTTAIRVQAYARGNPNWMFGPYGLRGASFDAAIDAARAGGA